MTDKTEKSARHRQGMATRRAVLGESYVDAAERRKTPFDAAFQEMITEAAWGHVWSRDTLSKRDRSLVTIALLAGLGNFEELQLHLRATINTGATREEIADVLLHVAIYAGVPRANHAVKLAKQIFDEIDGARG